MMRLGHCLPICRIAEKKIFRSFWKIPEGLKQRLSETRDIATLKRWHKLAAKVKSIDEFELKIGQT